MIKCGVCGSENELGAKFCGVCGSALDEAVAPTPPEPVRPAPPPPPVRPDGADDTVVPGRGDARRELGTDTSRTTTGPATGPATTPVKPEPDSGGPTIVCAVCGTVNDASRTYCRKCANELKPAAAAPPSPTPAPSGRRLSPLLVGLLAAGVVVAIGVGLILAMGGLGPGASPTTATSGSPGIPSGSPAVATSQPSAEATPPFGEDSLSGVILWAGGNRAGGQGDRQIFAASADGSGEIETLTDYEGFARDPGAAPDGSRIIYSTPDGLRLLDVASGDEEPLTEGGAPDINPSWSPDGERVVFTGRLEGGDDDEILIMDPDDPEPTPLTNNDVRDHDAIFTPDGEFVIWVQGDGDARELMMIELATNQITPLTDDGDNDVDPAVSRDGIVAFASNRGEGFDIWTIDLNDLTADPELLGEVEDGDAHDPWFSPGGRYVVFSAGGTDAEDLFILDRGDENSIEPFIEDPDNRELSPVWVAELP